MAFFSFAFLQYIQYIITQTAENFSIVEKFSYLVPDALSSRNGI